MAARSRSPLARLCLVAAAAAVALLLLLPLASHAQLVEESSKLFDDYYHLHPVSLLSGSGYGASSAVAGVARPYARAYSPAPHAQAFNAAPRVVSPQFIALSARTRVTRMASARSAHAQLVQQQQQQQQQQQLQQQQQQQLQQRLARASASIAAIDRDPTYFHVDHAVSEAQRALNAAESLLQTNSVVVQHAQQQQQQPSRLNAITAMLEDGSRAISAAQEELRRHAGTAAGKFIFKYGARGQVDSPQGQLWSMAAPASGAPPHPPPAASADASGAGGAPAPAAYDNTADKAYVLPASPLPKLGPQYAHNIMMNPFANAVQLNYKATENAVFENIAKQQQAPYSPNIRQSQSQMMGTNNMRPAAQAYPAATTQA